MEILLLGKFRLLPLLPFCAAMLLACGGGSDANTTSASTSFQPPHSSGMSVKVIAGELQRPWSIAFISDSRMLVTEKPGRLRVVTVSGAKGDPIAGLPPVFHSGQGGLLDVVADRDFGSSRTIYFSYAEGTPELSTLVLAKARLSDDESRLENVQKLFAASPSVASDRHFGGRIIEHPDGTLFLTVGERFTEMDQAQVLTTHLGKIIRVNKDGSVPPDNPYAQSENPAQRYVYSYGHRNPQGAALAPDGRLWANEHGPSAGDEINIVRPGRNYGWPLQSYGQHYDGTPIPDTAPGVELPVHHWTSTVAPSGMAFLTSDNYGAGWRGALFLGGLVDRSVHRLVLNADGTVASETRLQVGEGQRIRDIRMGPDGYLYGLTDEENGQLFRLEPGATPG